MTEPSAEILMLYIGGILGTYTGFHVLALMDIELTTSEQTKVFNSIIWPYFFGKYIYLMIKERRNN